MKKRKIINGDHALFKKMSLSYQAKYIQLIGELLANGFSIQEATDILLKINCIPHFYLKKGKRLLQGGHSFYDVLQIMGFTQEKLVQVELAETHGNLIKTLEGMAEQFRLVEEFRKEVKKLISYPCILFLFLLGILVALKQFILPQLLTTEMVMESHWGIRFLQAFHWYGLSGLIVAILVFLFIKIRMMKMDAIQKSVWLSSIRWLGPFFSLYQSAYIALEFGKLFYEGLELQHIILCLKETKQGSLIQLLAFRLTKGLEMGIPLAKQFQIYSFLTEEFSQIILQGEAKGNLGKELLFYSTLSRQQFFQKINRWLHWLQPILFLGIAGLILLIYAAILLPVYSNIEEVLL
ncbi:competence type IV pilus assembly protein ComGB [Enterococcus ratti]|nr:competence type IV pilus assembly protein ComGB [Enterococcus ratti]